MPIFNAEKMAQAAKIGPAKIESFYVCSDGKQFSVNQKGLAENHQSGLNLKLLVDMHERLRINLTEAVGLEHNWKRVVAICAAIERDIDHLNELIEAARKYAKIEHETEAGDK